MTVKRYSLSCFLLLFCFISVSSYGEDLKAIDVATASPRLTHFQIDYYIDESEFLGFPSIRNKEFISATNQLALGRKAPVTWIKIHFTNSSSEKVTRYLHFPYAFHNHELALIEAKEGIEIDRKEIDFERLGDQPWMYRGGAIFDIELAPKESKTVYIKSVAYASQWFTLQLYSTEESKRALVGKYTDISLIMGMMLALTFYNLTLYFSSRLKEHLYYACYLISGGIWIGLTFGFFADILNIYGPFMIKGFISLIAMPIFLLHFMMHIFGTKKRYPKEHAALMIMSALLTLDFIYGVFDILGAIKFATSLAGLMMLVSLGVSLSMLKHKHPIAPYFLFGHSLFIIFSVVSVLFFNGVLEFNYVTSHAMSIGILLEALILALIIAYRIRILEKLKRTQHQLQELASTDPLTKLFNRRAFKETVEQLMTQPKYLNRPLCVAIMDIDFFKKVNDTYGHHVGDEVIIKVAEELKLHCRLEDIPARYGGEEFVLFIPKTNIEEATAFIERIRQSIAEKAVTTEHGQTVHFTISIGLAELDRSKPDIDSAIIQADQALYQAKENGRNQCRIYSA
ncbi:sensor domain-containing diguanylate cyclase [Marinomonas epiphytica]